jgi:hypothetical protein
MLSGWQHASGTADPPQKIGNWQCRQRTGISYVKYELVRTYIGVVADVR